MGSQPTHTLSASEMRYYPHRRCPDRTLLTSSPLAVVAEPDRASGLAFS